MLTGPQPCKSPSPFLHLLFAVLLLYLRIKTYHYLPKSIVYIVVHKWCFTFCGFSKKQHDMYPPLGYHAHYSHCPKTPLLQVFIYLFPKSLTTTILLLSPWFCLPRSSSVYHGITHSLFRLMSFTQQDAFNAPPSVVQDWQFMSCYMVVPLFVHLSPIERQLGLI